MNFSKINDIINKQKILKKQKRKQLLFNSFGGVSNVNYCNPTLNLNVKLNELNENSDFNEYMIALKNNSVDEFYDKCNKKQKNYVVNKYIFNNIVYIKKNIFKIINVYQPEYKNRRATGFGDFIRGSYFIIQFCEKFKLEYEIKINHAIKNYLSFYSKKNKLDEHYEKNIPYEETKKFTSDEDIYFFEPDNFNIFNNLNSDDELIDKKIEMVYDFSCYLKEQKINNRSVKIYTISFPFQEITDKQQNKMKEILEPTNEIKQILNNALINNNLISNNYKVIQIRNGDNILINDEHLNEDFLKTIQTEINKIYMSSNKALNCKYLLISDSVKIKDYINKRFPNIITINNKITHIGEGVNLVVNDEKIKNTLLDFYLMANSNEIISFSCYEHGSGFSRWCATTYDIPYTCTIIKNE